MQFVSGFCTVVKYYIFLEFLFNFVLNTANHPEEVLNRPSTLLYDHILQTQKGRAVSQVVLEKRHPEIHSFSQKLMCCRHSQE